MENLIANLEKLPSKYAELSDIAAECESDYKNLDEQKKSFQASLEIKYACKTGVETTRLALASDEWKQFLKGLADSRSTYLMARSRLDSISVQLKVLQSLNSNSVAEKKLI